MAIVRDMSYSMARVMRPFTDYPIIEKRLLQIAIAEQFTIHLHKTCDDSHQHAAHTHILIQNEKDNRTHTWTHTLIIWLFKFDGHPIRNQLPWKICTLYHASMQSGAHKLHNSIYKLLCARVNFHSKMHMNRLEFIETERKGRNNMKQSK